MLCVVRSRTAKCRLLSRTWRLETTLHGIKRRSCTCGRQRALGASARLGVMRSVGENGGGVVPIPCPIPQQQRPRDVAFGGGEFCGEDAAADLEPYGGIAERRQRFVREPVFARDLTHYLHQSPGKCASARFGDVVDDAARNLRHDVFFVELRLIAQSPGIPGGLLLDDRADQFRPKCVCIGGTMCEHNEFCGRRQTIFSFAAELASVRVRFRLRAVQFREVHRRRVVDFDALMRSDAPQRVINVREMVEGHVANKCALDGGVAKPSMQPAEENTQLREQRKRNDQPIGIHAYTRERTYRRCLRSRTDLRNSRNVAIAACG
jgi:hypothetical protein